MSALKELLELAKREGKTECKRKLVSAIVLDHDAAHFFWNGPNLAGECSNVVGGCGCLHAEQRAIYSMLTTYKIRLGKMQMVVQYSPCTNCANAIILSQLFDTVYFETLTEHDPRGLEILKKNGVKVCSL